MPAELSTAHMASTYLPADVHRRLREVLGHRCLLVSAIDVHSVQASLDGKTRRGMDARIDHYDRRYRDSMAALDIELSVFERTDHPAHASVARSVLLDLQARSAIYEREREVWQCRGCDVFPPVRLTHAEPSPHTPTTPQSCPYCGGSDFVQVRRPHWHLELEPHRDRLRALSRVINPKSVRAWVDHALSEPLVDWNFSRDNAIGLPLPFGREDQSLYLWFESALGYMSMTRLVAREASPRFVHFHGKNIIWYHSVVWPVLLEAGFGVDASTARNSVRGFWDLRASDAELLDLEAIVSRYGVDYVRFYLSSSVPLGAADFRATTQELVRTCNTALCDKIGNILRRAQSILRRHHDRPRRRGSEAIADDLANTIVPKLERCGEFGDVRAALRVVVDYAVELNRMIHRERLFSDPSEAALGKLAHASAALMTLAAPFVPNLARAASNFVGWTPGTLADIDDALERPLDDTVVFWAKLPEP